jgi:hypothetical protein
MSITGIVTVISLIASIVNGMTCLLIYLRSLSFLKGVITIVRVDREGEVWS